jgi:hypothetical protein
MIYSKNTTKYQDCELSRCQYIWNEIEIQETQLGYLIR